MLSVLRRRSKNDVRYDPKSGHNRTNEIESAYDPKRTLGVIAALRQFAYVEIAVRLGTDQDWRDSVSAKISKHQHKLFERDEVVDELSDFLCAQLNPA